MCKIRLRLLRAGAVAFVLAAGQAANAQPSTTAPAQAPSQDVIDRAAAVERDYCNMIARARTTEEVHQVVNRLARAMTAAATYMQGQQRMKGEIAEARARLNEDEQMLAQRRAASPLGEIDGMIRTDQQIIADSRAKAVAIDGQGVNGGPSLGSIDQHIQAYTNQVSQHGTGQAELAQWQARRAELMAAKAPYADAYNNAVNDLAQQQARRTAAQAAFDQANAQFEQQVDNRQRELQAKERNVKRFDAQIDRLAPLVLSARSLSDTVLRCAQRREAQIGGRTPTPYAPQAPPSVVAGAPLAGQVRWVMTCTPNQGVFSGPVSGQLSTTVGANGAFTGTGPVAAGLTLQVTGQVDPMGVVRGVITDVQNSYLTGSLDRNAGQGSGQLGFNNPGGWGICAGQWQFARQ